MKFNQRNYQKQNFDDLIRYTGTVDRFENGWGFIQFEMGGRARRAFVHWSAIQMPGYKVLEEGQTVEFDVERNEKGLNALNVQVVD